MRIRGYRRHQQTRKRFGKWWLWLLLLSVALISPAVAQTYRPEVAAASVYQQIPDFPKANQYRLKDRKEVDPNNTLVSRLIRYHQDVKKRPTPYRLDWQLTMGDYLGVNEQMLSERYPGAGLLTSSPMEADIQLIRQGCERLRRFRTAAQTMTSAVRPDVRCHSIASPSCLIARRTTLETR
jgi:hypothetical protein